MQAGYKERIQARWDKNKAAFVALLNDNKSYVVPAVGLAFSLSLVMVSAYSKKSSNLSKNPYDDLGVGRLSKMNLLDENDVLYVPFTTLAAQHCLILAQQKDNEKNNQSRFEHIGERLLAVEERQRAYHVKTLGCFEALNKLFKSLLEGDGSDNDGLSATEVYAECDRLIKEWSNSSSSSSSSSSNSQ